MRCGHHLLITPYSSPSLAAAGDGGGGWVRKEGSAGLWGEGAGEGLGVTGLWCGGAGEDWVKMLVRNWRLQGVFV